MSKAEVAASAPFTKRCWAGEPNEQDHRDPVAMVSKFVCEGRPTFSGNLLLPPQELDLFLRGRGGIFSIAGDFAKFIFRRFLVLGREAFLFCHVVGVRSKLQKIGMTMKEEKRENKRRRPGKGRGLPKTPPYPRQLSFMRRYIRRDVDLRTRRQGCGVEAGFGVPTFGLGGRGMLEARAFGVQRCWSRRVLEPRSVGVERYWRRKVFEERGVVESHCTVTVRNHTFQRATSKGRWSLIGR